MNEHQHERHKLSRSFCCLWHRCKLAQAVLANSAATPCNLSGARTKNIVTVVIMLERHGQGARADMFEVPLLHQNRWTLRLVYKCMHAQPPSASGCSLSLHLILLYISVSTLPEPARPCHGQNPSQGCQSVRMLNGSWTTCLTCLQGQKCSQCCAVVASVQVLCPCQSDGGLD